MNRFILFLFTAVSSIGASAQFPSGDDCPLNIDAEKCQWVWHGRIPNEEITLYGKVYVAKDGEPYDLLIRKARKDESADMTVGIVKKYPDECGLWQWTNKRSDANFVVKFVKKVGDEHLVVYFVDGETLRHDTDLPCEDWSTGRPRPCK